MWVLDLIKRKELHSLLSASGLWAQRNQLPHPPPLWLPHTSFPALLWSDILSQEQGKHQGPPPNNTIFHVNLNRYLLPTVLGVEFILFILTWTCKRTSPDSSLLLLSSFFLSLHLDSVWPALPPSAVLAQVTLSDRLLKTAVSNRRPYPHPTHGLLILPSVRSMHFLGVYQSWTPACLVSRRQ